MSESFSALQKKELPLLMSLPGGRQGGVGEVLAGSLGYPGPNPTQDNILSLL